MAKLSLARFFRSWWRAHSDTHFYQTILIWTKRRTFLFVIGAYALLSLAQVVAAYAITLPAFGQEAYRYWIEDVSLRLPENLKLSYNDGHLVAEPAPRLTLPFPRPLRDQGTVPKNVITIDTRPEAKPETEPTLIFIASAEARIQPSQKERPPILLTELLGTDTWTLTKNDIENEVQVTQMRWPKVRALASGMIGISTVALLLPWRLVFLLLYTWIGQTILVLMGNRLRYWDAFRLGLLLLVPSETMLFLARLLYPHQMIFEFWVIWLALLMIVSYTNRKKLQ